MRGQYHALLDEAASVLAKRDTGADIFALAQTNITALERAENFISTKNFAEPFKLNLVAQRAVSNCECYVSHACVRLSITLQTKAGPIGLRNVNFQVVDAYMDEVLLSRPLFSSMSLDLDNRPNEVFTTFHDVEFSHVGGTIDKVMESHESSKLARIL